MSTDAPHTNIQILSELSGNHQGSFECAMQLIHAADLAGMNAVKIQTYTPESMTTLSEQGHENWRDF